MGHARGEMAKLLDIETKAEVQRETDCCGMFSML